MQELSAETLRGDRGNFLTTVSIAGAKIQGHRAQHDDVQHHNGRWWQYSAMAPASYLVDEMKQSAVKLVLVIYTTQLEESAWGPHGLVPARYGGRVEAGELLFGRDYGQLARDKTGSEGNAVRARVANCASPTQRWQVKQVSAHPKTRSDSASTACTSPKRVCPC